MLNNTGITREMYASSKQILFATQHSVSVGVVVDESVGAVVGKKKIAKAGTPVTGNLDSRTTAFTLAKAGSESEMSDAVGILLHDVDVTVGDNNASILLFGFVNTNRLEEDVKTKITKHVKEALPMIKFVAC